MENENESDNKGGCVYCEVFDNYDFRRFNGKNVEIPKSVADAREINGINFTKSELTEKLKDRGLDVKIEENSDFISGRYGKITITLNGEIYMAGRVYDSARRDC